MGVGVPGAGAGRSGRVTARLTYSGRGPRRGGPHSQWAGAGGGPAGGEGEPTAGGRGGGRGRAPNPVPSGSPTAPAAGRSSSGGGRSGSGQAAQLREGSRRAAARRHPARARPAATMPKRKVSGGRGPYARPPPPGPPRPPLRGPRPAALTAALGPTGAPGPAAGGRAGWLRARARRPGRGVLERSAAEEPGGRFERGGGKPLTSRGRALFWRAGVGRARGARALLFAGCAHSRVCFLPQVSSAEGAAKEEVRARASAGGWVPFALHPSLLVLFSPKAQEEVGEVVGCK